MFTYELARRLEGTGVTATVLHPGVVRTAFAAEDPSLWKVMIPLMRPLMKSPAKGADTSIYLASSPEVEGVTGKYFVNRKPRTSTSSPTTRLPRPGCGGPASTLSAAHPASSTAATSRPDPPLDGAGKRQTSHTPVHHQARPTNGLHRARLAE